MVAYSVQSYFRRINRNILECKARYASQMGFAGTSINRNILECKEDVQLFLKRLRKVLIETYWNVKT